MSEILSQAEIEALLNSLNSESADAVPATPMVATPVVAKPSQGPGSLDAFPKARATKSRIAYEVYDFRRPDKLSKDQLRTLQMIHETFARLAASSLSAYLRCPVQIDLISLEQIPYEEYLRSINQSVFTIISLPPLTGQAVLEIEFGLVFSMVDRLLGGPGKAISRANLTDIERPLVKQTIERMFSALKSAWEGLVIVNPGIEGMETSSQFVQIAPPNDIAVTILFEVRVGSQRGAMSLCVPYLVLKPITTKLSAQKWFVNGGRRQSNTSRKLLSNQIGQTNINCSIRLGSANLSIGSFLDLRPGDIVRLDQKTKRDITMLVADVPKFYGRPALDGKHVVFSVTEPIQE